MAARIYTVPYTGTLTAAGGNSDLLLALPADDKPIRLREIILGQTTELGDAQEEGLQISVHRFTATVTNGSGGSAVTPASLDGADTPAAGFTARCNDSTVATTVGTDTVTHYLGWNERGSPLEVMFPDERFCPKAVQGEAIIVRCDTTPADDLTIQLTFVIEEL